ncbi:MAG: Do family serine endopeptidase [Planctomycetes bacterium]|nr:Do family serine endopeptidase [Planctomycetota bacterium]
MTRKITISSLARGSFLGLLFLFTPFAIANENDDSNIIALKAVSSAFRKVAKEVTPSVVTIETSWEVDSSQKNAPHPFFRYFGPQDMPTQKGAGSGVIFDKAGHIITNSHVIDGASKIEVVMNDDSRYEAELVGHDPKTDLALLKIEAKDLIPAIYGNSDTVEVGDWAIAIGNPLGFSQSVTVGIISAKGRHGLRRASDMAYEDFIQTDASINQGNSGGPLCNIDSEVIGINSMIASQSGGSQGLGFTIPINMAVHIINQLINDGEIQRGFLGVQIDDISKSLASQFDYDSTKGAFINEVLPDSPAALAGLESGDIIIKINDKEITNSHDLRNIVSQNSPGEKVALEVFRNGRSTETSVTLGTLDVFGRDSSLLGMSLREINEEEAALYRTSSGLLITEIRADSPAANAGLQVNMVIASVDRKSINSLEEFRLAVVKSTKGVDKDVLLYIKTPNSAFFIVLEK